MLAVCLVFKVFTAFWYFLISSFASIRAARCHVLLMTVRFSKVQNLAVRFCPKSTKCQVLGPDQEKNSNVRWKLNNFKIKAPTFKFLPSIFKNRFTFFTKKSTRHNNYILLPKFSIKKSTATGHFFINIILQLHACYFLVSYLLFFRFMINKT